MISLPKNDYSCGALVWVPIKDKRKALSSVDSGYWGDFVFLVIQSLIDPITVNVLDVSSFRLGVTFFIHFYRSDLINNCRKCKNA